jgi:polysaccharide export outer membrane protein
MLLLVRAAVGQEQAAAEPPYRLAAGDTVRVTVFGHEDLSGNFEVDATGRIALPLIDNVMAAGRSIDELELEIADKLMPEYLVNPQVSVDLASYRPFYIVGEVQSPGRYPYVNGMTVIGAVAVAGGYTYRARKTGIKILRGAEGLQQKITATPDTPVMPGDVIEVAERFF